MSDSPPSCPDCGSPLPADSPQALCPACLMRQVLASRTVVPEGGSHATTPPPAPEDIADRFPQFEIIECLGRGGMGVVYKARQKSLNRLVAIKILAPERGHESRFAERFAREAELLAKLNHPHIVTIHDFGVTDSQPSATNSQPLYYLVMEFVDGVNLRDLLREGKLEPKQALAIVPPICEALQYAHDKGIVHRDIKPENLLLDREGRIKIADFGIAALMGSEGEEAGTPPYMAPEQSGQSSGIDHRADLYALGVVLYEMLTGERPTMDLVAPSRKVQIDVRLDEMVLRALEKTPELRYQTAAEFRTMVETLAAPAVEQEASNRERRKKRKKKVVFSLPDPLPSKGALLGIAFAAVGVGVLVFIFAAQGWERISRSLSESSEALHLVRFGPMSNGLVIISFLVAVIPIGGFVYWIRRPRQVSGGVRGAPLWFGVIALLGVLIFGWFVMKKGRFYPTSSLDPAYTAPIIGRVEFECTHPKGGGSRFSFVVKAWGDTQWSPTTGHTLGLEGGRSIQYQTRVDASRSPVPVAMVATSLNGAPWETQQVELRAGSPNQALEFSNGLHATIAWSPIEVSGLEKLSPDPIQRKVMRQASLLSDAAAPVAEASPKTGGSVSVENEAQRMIDAEKVIRDANDYLDLVIARANAVREGMGDQHPNVAATRKALERFQAAHPDLSKPVLKRLAGERLARFKEEVDRIQDGGLGHTHPMVLGITARAEAMEAVIGGE